MPHVRYGDVSLACPPGWEDGTLITFVAPLRPPSRLRGVKRAEEKNQANLVIRRSVLNGEEIELAEFAAMQEEMMADIGTQVKVRDRFEMFLGAENHQIPALACEFSFKGGGVPMWQLQVYCQAGDNFFIICGTSPADEYSDETRQHFIDTIRGMRFHNL